MTDPLPPDYWRDNGVKIVPGSTLDLNTDAWHDARRRDHPCADRRQQAVGGLPWVDSIHPPPDSAGREI